MSLQTCERCDWGPCRLPDWARDGSWFANDPNGLRAQIARRHWWFEEPWLRGVREAVAGNAAMVLAPTYSCVDCGQFAFHQPGVICFWCRRSRATAAA